MGRYSELSEKDKIELLFTDEERKQLDEARKMPFIYDEDCPPVTPEKAIKFKRVNQDRQIKRA